MEWTHGKDMSPHMANELAASTPRKRLLSTLEEINDMAEDINKRVVASHPSMHPPQVSADRNWSFTHPN